MVGYLDETAFNVNIGICYNYYNNPDLDTDETFDTTSATLCRQYPGNQSLKFVPLDPIKFCHFAIVLAPSGCCIFSIVQAKTVSLSVRCTHLNRLSYLKGISSCRYERLLKGPMPWFPKGEINNNNKYRGQIYIIHVFLYTSNLNRYGASFNHPWQHIV